MVVATGTSGTAMIYVEVNRSPSDGACSIVPDDEGVEMETEFRVYCHDWRDEVRRVK